MTPHRHPMRAALAGLFATTFGLAPLCALASERESLENLRETTSHLIEALVEQGVITRAKADAVIKAAQAKAKASAKQAPPAAVRVQYVPESVKNEIRQQLKTEVLAQARSERWAEPNAVPAWVDNVKWEGDLRLSYRLDKLDQDNTTAATYRATAGGGTTRAAGFTTANAGGTANANTVENRERYRLRARLGVLGHISEQWSAGLRLATGSATDRVSTNQTLGQDWNKYSVFVDRAYIRYDPAEWLSLSGGRIANPWFSTDLVWDDDLNFEGLAATLKNPRATDSFRPFLTVGAFPLKEENPPATRGRMITGIQGGSQWEISGNMRLKFGAAWYSFANLEGRRETNADFAANAVTYGQYEYSANLRQKGNTLFRTNAVADGGSTIWGLASRFRPLNLTASLDLAHFDPVHLVLTGDYVKNTAFDRSEILARTGVTLTDGQNYGYLYKLTLGMPKIAQARDWQMSFAYRYLGSDAVLDAFTDSDFGLGGTNLKGYSLGLSYGLDRNAALGLRWISASAIDSFSLNPAHRFGADVLQADVNVRF